MKTKRRTKRQSVDKSLPVPKKLKMKMRNQAIKHLYKAHFTMREIAALHRLSATRVFFIIRDR